MTYVFAFDDRHDLPLPELKTLIGSKAASIATMATELQLPVPPAFTISTVACRRYLVGGWPPGLDDEIRHYMVRIERAVGRRFGDPADPLLVSVRSGAPLSMPGMMDTILNLGLNDVTEHGLGMAAGDPGFAADCRARFDKVYRDIVGVDIVPDDPWAQLRGAIEAVFRSWNSDRARAYRAHEGISDDLGTGVTVQTMVFGNRGNDSGAGVLFTRNPATGEPILYGDVMFNAQGEDVVAGNHQTEPITVLDERMPAVGAELRRNAVALERHYADCCDIEFTIERGKLWMLQVRVGKRSPQAALRMAVDMAEAPDFPLSRADAVRRVAGLLARPPVAMIGGADTGPALTTGLPASPGVVCGEIVVTPDAAVAAADAGRDVILVRAETSPDDVHGIARAVGILTSTGGLASHAAVVARGWGVPAVVGAVAVQVGPDSVEIAGRRFDVGEVITIDGTTGEVFAGSAAGTREVVPEAAKLLEWARDLGIGIGEEGNPVAPQPEATTSAVVTADDVLRALVVKGYATPDGTAVALLCDPEAASALLDRLVADGLAEIAAGSFRLTADGRSVGKGKIGADTEVWGAKQASAALDGFIALDVRVKTTVTAWQMREVEGAQTFNDHSDAPYDAGILAELDALHSDVVAWLSPLVAGLPRLAVYGERLGRAAAAARGGDGRYVASPRVDSYHGVWFELHEDLILLAGRSRADEMAAGRA